MRNNRLKPKKNAKPNLLRLESMEDRIAPAVGLALPLQPSLLLGTVTGLLDPSAAPSQGDQTFGLAGANGQGGNANAQGGNANAQGDNANAQGGNANAQGGNANAQGGNANAQGGNANAQGGNANAQGGNANAQGGNANAQGGNANAQGGNANAQGGNANAQGGNANAQGGNANAQGGNANGQGSSTGNSGATNSTGSSPSQVGVGSGTVSTSPAISSTGSENSTSVANPGNAKSSPADIYAPVINTGDSSGQNLTDATSNPGNSTVLGSSGAGRAAINTGASQIKDSAASDQAAADPTSAPAGGAASQHEALDAAIRSLMLPSSLAAFMAKSADGKANMGNSALPPNAAASEALQPEGKLETHNETGEMFDPSALQSLSILVKRASDSDDVQSETEDEMSPAQAAEQILPAKVAGFVDRFTPFDAHGMDQAIQRFMNQLQVQDQSLDGGLRLRRLAVISTAIALGIGSVEFIRRKKSGLQIPRFLTSTLGYRNVPVNS